MLIHTELQFCNQVSASVMRRLPRSQLVMRDLCVCCVQIAQTSHAKYGELEKLYPAAVSSCIRCHTEGWRTGGRSTCTASWKSTQYRAVSALTPWLNWRRLETPSTLGRCMVYRHDVVSGVATSAKRAAAMPQQPHVLSQCPALAQCS